MSNGSSASQAQLLVLGARQVEFLQSLDAAPARAPLARWESACGKPVRRAVAPGRRARLRPFAEVNPSSFYPSSRHRRIVVLGAVQMNERPLGPCEDVHREVDRRGDAGGSSSGHEDRLVAWHRRRWNREPDPFELIDLLLALLGYNPVAPTTSYPRRTGSRGSALWRCCDRRREAADLLLR